MLNRLDVRGVSLASAPRAIRANPRMLAVRHAHRETAMIATFGLSHLSLAVLDPERSLAFYSAVFGVREYYRDTQQIQVQGPGPFDVLAFECDRQQAGKPGGIGHFGFRLQRPGDIGQAVAEVLQAGGALVRQGEFGPGLPCAFVTGPDGYQIEIWYEPTA